MLLKANNKPQMQERRPPLKIHFTIQLGYFTGVKKEGDAGVYSSTIYGLVYLHFMEENGAAAAGPPSFHLLTQKMISPLGP